VHLLVFWTAQNKYTIDRLVDMLQPKGWIKNHTYNGMRCGQWRTNAEIYRKSFKI